MDILAALRLCTNLQSFSLGSTKHICVHRVDQMLSNYLRVLQRLRVPKISIYSQSSLSPQVLTSLMYMNDVKEIEVHTIGGGFVRAEAMAAALRRRVTHLAFTVSPDEKVSYTACKSIRKNGCYRTANHMRHQSSSESLVSRACFFAGQEWGVTTF